MGAKPHHSENFRGIVVAIATVLLTAVWLAGCGGGSGMGDIMQGAGGLFGSSPKIAVGTIVGAPKNIATELTQALQTAGADRNLTILPSGSADADYTMRGYLLSAVDGSRSRISYVWDVNDAAGKRVTRVSGEEVVARGSDANPWRGMNATAIRNIANNTTSQLAANLPGGRGAKSPPATASSPPTGRTAAIAGGTAAATGAAVASKPGASAAPTPSGVIVGSVTGAPGDGSRALPAALKKQLPRAGVKVVRRGTNVYTVNGTVKLTSAGTGKETIRIDWRVMEPNGTTKGTVSQENTIPKGSLNGPWGAIADAAASAAVPGIKKLVQ